MSFLGQMPSPHDAVPSPFRERRLLDECRRAEHRGEAFVLLLIALDGDQGGAPAQALALMGDSLRTGVRHTDLVARVGPALYAVLLIGANPKFAESIGERLVGRVRSEAGPLLPALAAAPMHFGMGVFGSAITDAATLIAAAERDLDARRLGQLEPGVA